MIGQHRPMNVLLPCRAGSQRVPHKNTQPLPGYPGGLLELKLKQVADCRLVDTVVLSTDDPECIQVAEDNREPYGDRLRIVPRPEEFAKSGNLDPFVRHVAEIMPEGDVAWMHVTSPFFDAQEIDRAILAFRQAYDDGTCDSLMGVTRLQTFLWDKAGCVSHDRNKVKWPQTQDLEPLWEVNSSIFIITRDLMKLCADRIGERPLLHEVDRNHAFDIDWPEDFDFLVRRLIAQEPR
jgi:CMP-N-acetylneuraminic acid synthetase